MPTYNPNVPTGTVNLDVDYQNIQDNFNEANVVIGIDHTGLDNNTSQKGYHTVIHQIPYSGTPANVVGYSEIYCKLQNDNYINDTQMFFQSGTGINVAMTRNFLPVAASPGITFLPGGLVIQWGVFTFSSSGSVTFVGLGAQAFKTSCFNIQATANSTSGSTFNLNVSNLTNTGFDYKNTRGSSADYFWFAIGI